MINAAKKILIIGILCGVAFASSALGLDTTSFNKGTPHRIIRTCCAFGNEVGLAVIPFIKMSDIISKENIGTHQYLGGKSEGNGIMYTYKGGFIDLGHLRDQSDWTAYLHSLILNNRGNPNTEIMLGKEGGLKTLVLQIPSDISSENAVLLAGRIAYDLSVWHEIATWYGASTVPFVPERYSSFSVEDDYSNQLGVVIGIQALLSNQPYNEAVTSILKNKLDTLEVVQTIEESYQAMDMVNGKWWSQEYKFPSKNFLLKHQIASYDTTYPLLIPELSKVDKSPLPVEIPMNTINNIPLTNFYSLIFKLNGKIPYAKIFHEKKVKKLITNHDFLLLLENIHKETQLLKYRKLKRKAAKKYLT